MTVLHFSRPSLLLLALFSTIGPLLAQSLAERDQCFRSEVTRILEGSIWQSSGDGGVISVAEFRPGGQYYIAAYNGLPGGTPALEFDGTWAFVGESFISVEMMGMESFYVVTNDLTVMMNKTEAVFRPSGTSVRSKMKGRTLNDLLTECSRLQVQSDADGPDFAGVYEGIQPGYAMRNDDGEIVRIAGKTIDVPAIQHVFTLGKEQATLVQVALDETHRRYSYSGNYLNHDVGPDGQHAFKIEFDNHDGSEPIFLLYQSGPDAFKVIPNGRNEPEFQVNRPPTVTETPRNTVLFDAVILSNKKNVNVRSSPPSGDVVNIVQGGQVFPVHEIREMSDPIFLLTEETELNRADEQGTLRKAANYKLEDVKDAGTVYFANVLDNAGNPVRVIVSKNLVSVRRDAWYRSETLGGWVFSGLCTAREGCSQ